MKTPKLCLWCKDKFVPRAAGRPQKYCSELCKKAYEKKAENFIFSIFANCEIF